MKKKVLIVNPILYTSETDNIPKVNSIKDTMIYSLCMGFAENGDIPVLAASEDYKPTIGEEYPFEIIWFKSVLPKIFKPRCLPKFKGFRRFLLKTGKKYDYIISGEVFSICTFDVATTCKDKLIIWHELGAHNNLMHKIPSKIWYNLVARMFYRNVPIIPRSQNARQFISKYCSRISNTIIDHGVDINDFAAVSEKDKYFVVVSQLVARKRINKIIEAFNISGYKLFIIGDGPERVTLEKQANILSTECVEFLGKKNHQELIPILSKAAGLLIYTQKDNSMVSIVESIACGTPVLTTSVPFNSTYIKEYNLGIVQDDWTSEDLKDLILNNAKYIENCIKYREKLSTKYMAQQFNHVADSLLRL